MKYPAIVEFVENNIIYNYRSMVTVPHVDSTIETIYLPGRTNSINVIAQKKFSDINMEFLETFDESNKNILLKICSEHSSHNQTGVSKRNIKIIFEHTRFFLLGCYLTNATFNFIDDEQMFEKRFFKNYNFLKREVLFEKVGNEKINTVLELTFHIDGYSLLD